MKYLYIILPLILFLILNSCCGNRNYSGVYYEVIGTKTNVTIKYRAVSVDRAQEEELTTIIVEKLPWTISAKMIVQSSCEKRREWFLSAYSKSEGSMELIIKRSQYNIISYYDTNIGDTVLNEDPYASIIVSNGTTNNYAEISSVIDHIR